MVTRASRVVSILAAGLALPYVASKVVFASEGRLGIHGGPRVTPADYAPPFDDAGMVALAQGMNAVMGAVLIVVALLPLFPWGPRLRRVLSFVPPAAGLLLLAFGVFSLIRAFSPEIGGMPFAVYLLVWGGVLLTASALSRTGTPDPVTAPVP